MRQRRPRADSSAGRSSPSTRGGAELIPSRAAGSGSQAWRARSSWWGERGGCWEGLFKSCLRGFWIAGMRALCCTPIKRYHHADARVLAGHSWKPRPHRSPGAEAPPPCLRFRPFPRATKGGSPAHHRAPQRRCAALRFRSRCHGSAGGLQSAVPAALPQRPSRRTAPPPPQEEAPERLRQSRVSAGGTARACRGVPWASISSPHPGAACGPRAGAPLMVAVCPPSGCGSWMTTWAGAASPLCPRRKRRRTKATCPW